MTEIVFKRINPSIILNTIMHEMYIDGVFKFYRIAPVDGFLLHDSRADGLENDFVTPIENFSKGTISVSAGYDFSLVKSGEYKGNTYQKYGEYLLYAVPEGAVGDE